MIFGKHQVALGVLGMLIMGRALPVWAAETADGNVQEIVITANRMENKKVDTPANVSLVSSEDLTNWNSRSVADALENVPGVRVVRNGLGTNGANVYLNGEERVLFLVDGRRVNTSMGNTSTRETFDANTLPPVDLIDHIEIVKDGASTVYGADAVGGVINIITKSRKRFRARSCGLRLLGQPAVGL